MPSAPDDLRARVTRVIDKNGTEKTSRALGVASESLTRVVAGLNVRNGTIAQIEKRLAELEK